MTSIVDESIISDFVAESREHLNALEPDLLAMEQGGGSLAPDVINRVFRAIHSIKGGAGFLAFDHLKRLSHAMESVLTLVRDGKLAVTPGIMDILFSSLDRLRAMLDDIQASDGIPVQTELSRLHGVLEGQGLVPGAQIKARSAPEDPRNREFDLDASEVASALARGMNLFHATAFLRRDIKEKDQTPLAFLNNALSVGQCLDAYIDLMDIPDLEHCLEEDLAVSILFATVLEPDLAALALGLPPVQVAMLDMKRLRREVGHPPPALAARVAPVPMEAPVEASAEAAAEAAGETPEAAPGSPLGAAPPSRDNREGAAETLRVRVDLLTELMNQAGELVLSRNQLLMALAGHQKRIPGLAAILQNINQVTSELQEGIMQTRMQPIGTIFNRFPRIVRDMAKGLAKQIDIQIQGAEVELDKSIVELLADPLTHIIRNCADHALEAVEERRKARKNPTGQILLHAYHEGGQVNIAITDDGRGIDPAKVLRKALDKGLVTAARAQEMSEREIVNLVFAPGFTTSEAVTDISGRGVGMDVVRSNTEKLGGHVELETHVGIGTTVLLRLPLTLAIIPSMIVGVGASRFAIPQVNVVEFVWVRAADVARRIERVNGAQVLRLRDQLLPLIRLADVLDMVRTYRDPGTGAPREDRRQEIADRRSLDGRPEEAREGDRRSDWRSDYNIVVLRLGSNQFGVIVDELFDIEEIVVKPLSEPIQTCRCFSGATITGDGRVIMILDAGGLASQARLHFADLQAEGRKRQEEERRLAAAAASRRRSIIVCTGAPGEHFAVPQERVMRLEKIRMADVQVMGDQEFVDYRGHGLPLVRLDRHLAVGPIPPDLQEVFLIIPKVLERGVVTQAKAGIVISDIRDALDVEVELEDARIPGPGILGSAILQHHLTLFIEPLDLLQAAGLLGAAGGPTP